MTASSLLSVQPEGELTQRDAGDGFQIFLTHYPPDGVAASQPQPLLFIHGGSAWSNTFRVRTENGQLSVVEFFQREGYDVWLLDWRGGSRKEVRDQVLSVDREVFTIDRVARFDIPTALHFVGTRAGAKTKVDVIAHCMGAGCLAFGLGHTQFRDAILEQLGKVVLCTLGLFYESPWDGVAKVQDHVLDFIMGTDPSCRCISPGANRWPNALEFAFSKWPRSWKPSCGNSFCERLAFMFGSPYLETNMSAGIHDSLAEFFGSIPIALYAHAAQNALRGYAAPFNVEGENPPPWEACLDLKAFEKLNVGLVTGGQNILWHPDSIHRMYDWLRRKLPDHRCQKRVFAGYGHQDLFWGKNAAAEIFPELLKLLRCLDVEKVLDASAGV